MSPRIRSASIAFRLSYWVPALAVAAALVFLAWSTASPAAAQEGNAGTEPANVMLFADGVPAEGGEPVTIIAGLRDPAGPEGVSVTLTTGGTATGDDYSLSANLIHVAPGATAGLATITATDDGLDDDSETVILNATDSSSSLAAAPLTLTIMDNDDGGLAITSDCNPLTTRDYDRDNDKLIDVCNLAQLNAIRWDPSTNGRNVYSSNYRAAYPNARKGMGCPAGNCEGYELTANLDFDTNANGRADAGDAFWNGGQGWMPFTLHGVIHGNGRTISNLFVSTPNSGAGLLSTLGQRGVVRHLKLDSVNVSSQKSNAGGLAGENSGTIIGVHVSGAVSGASAVGGLAGAVSETGSVITSVATASVVGSRDDTGGLVGRNNGQISASYATGSVSGSAANIGGLVGRGESTSVSDSYFDTVTSGQAASAGGTGVTSSELQQPTTYEGIYADWNVDGDGNGFVDDPWCFWTSNDYPTLRYFGPCRPPRTLQYRVGETFTDYDTDDDGLIEISNLAQLSISRWDLDGDGSPDGTFGRSYAAAFPNAAYRMGCAGWVCAGYELTSDLDFDTNGNGRADSGDTYWNGGQGWVPLGFDAAFLATFDGNGHTIRNLYIDRNRDTIRIDRNSDPGNAGLFGSLASGGVIRNVVLESVNVSGSGSVGGSVGGLVGQNAGIISDSSVSGSVSGKNSVGGLVGATASSSVIARSSSTANVTGTVASSSGGRDVGGLVGSNEGAIRATYAAGSVSGQADNVGGLVGYNDAGSVIIASYAVGQVSSSGRNIGGLVGHPGGTITASYRNTDTSLAGGTGGVGKTTAELQQPTDYTGIYAQWNVDLDGDGNADDPWNFGTSSQYPMSKGGNSGLAAPRAQVPVAHDYDTDDDGLIEVSSLAQLNAIRGDTWGRGNTAYSVHRTGYPHASGKGRGMGCPRHCRGYELATDLDFDTNGNGYLDSGDWNGGRRWQPLIGVHGAIFNAIFEGNGYTIRNLVVQGSRNAGLFEKLGSRGIIRNVRLESVDINGSVEVGGLVGTNDGTVSGSSVSGSVSGSTSVGGLVGSAGSGSVIAGSHSTASVTVPSSGEKGGGLVGSNEGAIRGSYATGAVSAGEADNVGGLVGYSHPTGVIIASYAVGEVSGSGQNIGGLVGHHAGTVIASYWNTVLSKAGGSGGVGKTTTELQSPTAYTSTYAQWNVDLDGDGRADDPWDFGTSSEYPVLKYGGLSVAEQRALMPTIPAVAVANGLEDVTIVHGRGTREISLAGAFSDADGESVAGLTITARSSDEAVATVSVASDYSTLTVTAQDRGTATITATAADGSGGTAEDTFTVRVKATPVGRTFPDMSGLKEGATRDISPPRIYFYDADGDVLTITALSSDEAIATVTVSADGSTLTVAGVAEGTATITVTAEDSDGNRVSNDFDVSVVKNYADLITKMKEWRNDPCCASNKAHTDRWDRALLAFGETVDDTTLTPMTADEAQEFADRGWERWVEVTAALREIEAAEQRQQQQQQGTPNQAPTVSSAIADATIVNESGTKEVSLSGVFSDGDNDALTISAASSNEAVATVSVAIDYSTLTVNAQDRGTAAITVAADDGNGVAVSDTFTVKVKAAPMVASAISDVNGLEAGATQEVSLSGTFSDADGDTLTITAASSDDSKATATVAADQSKLTVAGAAEGTATITVTAQDSDGNRASDTFDVSVATPRPQVNQAPTVANAIADATIVNESGTKQISLSGAFSDADNDALTVTASSSAESVVTVSVASDYSSLTVNGQARGTATITATADDGNGGTVSDTFTIRVKAVPVVASAISDVSGLEVDSTQEVSLSAVFSDADGDTLTITAASYDEAIATVSVASDGSALTVAGVAEGTATITVTAQDSDGNRVSGTFEAPVAKRYAALVAQMMAWRNDPELVDNKEHTDRWDRALLAFGETVSDTSLTPMTAAEAQELADRGWSRWEGVADALQELETSGQQQQQGTPNQPPTVANAIADATIVNESGTRQVSLSGTFTDADNDSLTVTAASDDETVATVSVASDYSTLTVSARSRGTANITATADDGNGGTVSDTFTVRVKAAPLVASAISDVNELEAGATQEVSLSGTFSDADGDTLTITATSSDDSKATATVAADQSKLTVAGVAEGTATITVTAQDSDGNRVSDTFDVSVLSAEAKDEAPTPVANLRCKVDTDQLLFRWDAPEWSGGETYAYDFQLTLPGGGTESGWVIGGPVLYRTGEYQAGSEATVSVKAVYQLPDGSHVSSAEETLTCTVAE